MGTFGYQAIVDAIARKQIRISPLEDANIGPNGYDFRLGNYYYTERPVLGRNEICPWDENANARLWTGPIDARNGNWMIPIHPGQTILAHTNEFIYTGPGLLVSIACRSSIARLGLSIVKCAGKGDDGYSGRWTVEISNHRQYSTVLLPVGARIGQFVFEDLTGAAVRQTYSGKYGKEPQDWTPGDMLPKLYRDREVDAFLDLEQYIDVRSSNSKAVRAFAEMRYLLIDPIAGPQV